VSAPSLTGLEKVAVLLKGLPQEAADKVMRHLDPRHAGLISSELNKLDNLGDFRQKLPGVLEEAVGLLGDGARDKPVTSDSEPRSGTKAATPAATPKKATVDIRIDSVPEPPAADAKPAASAETSADPLQELAGLPAELLAAALESENTRTTSLLMNCLDIDVAGKVYKRLSPAKRKEVSLRFTEQPKIGDMLIKRIALGVLQKCRVLQQASPLGGDAEDGRERRMAALLRALERTERMEILTALEEADAATTTRVKALLYQFEDILNMANMAVQKLLAEVETKTLALALHGAPRSIEERVFGNLSKRAQEALREEMSLTGVVPTSKARAARDAIVEAIQRLDQRGDLVMKE
jgi:flagellar motor switch protein FliG